MARPSGNSPPDQFTSTAMALGMGVSARNFLLLIERGLGPKPAVTGPGKAATRYWDMDGFTEAAICGGLHKGGIGLFGAARLASLIMVEEARTRGRFPSGIEFLYLSSKLPRPDKTDDFWLHHHLRQSGVPYAPRKALARDVVVEIVDRRYVISGKTHERIMARADGFEGAPLCRIENWTRDDMSIVPAWEDDAEPATYAAARDNAVSVLQVNMSLAIRTALDEVFEFREGRQDGK